MNLSRTEKIIIAYAIVGVLVRLSGRAITTTVNAETFVLSAALWPAVLLNGFSGVPVMPTPATIVAASA